MTSIKEDSLLIVFQDDIQYKVKFSKLQKDVVDLAVQKTPTYEGEPGIIIPGEAFEYDRQTGLLDVPLAKRPSSSYSGGLIENPGVPGLMYPGMGLSYNEETGELTRDFETSLTFAGLIGFKLDQGHVIGPSIDDQTGYFYVVADADHEFLNDNWGSSSGERVNVGDKVIRKYDGNWAIVPDVSGSMAVFKITSETDALVVDDTSPQFPVLTIDNAQPSDIISFGANGMAFVRANVGMDGLMSAVDKAKLDNLNVLLNEPFISTITPVEPIVTTETTSGTDNRLVHVEIDINDATTSSRGVVKLTTDSQITKLIQDPTDPDLELDELNTMSTTQIHNFYLPRDFRTLEGIS